MPVADTSLKGVRAGSTGSGGGSFVEFADRTAAEAALALLPAGLRAWVVEGAARSPLLDALAQVRGTEKNA